MKFDELLKLIAQRDPYWWKFFRHAKRLDADQIAIVLARAKPKDPFGILLRELHRLGVSWTDSLQVAHELQQFHIAWGAKVKKANYAKLAKRPEVLEAIQSVVVGAKNPPNEMLAVLARDGSEASLDALMPIFAGKKRNEDLQKLKTHAADVPALQAMFGVISEARSKTQKASGATAFMSRLLGEELEAVRFRVRIDSTDMKWQGALSISSDMKGMWWWVHLGNVSSKRTSRWDSTGTMNDADSLGFTTLEALPQFLQRTAKTPNVTWRRGKPHTTLRGKKREVLLDWVFGA